MKVNNWLKNILFRPYCLLCLAPTTSVYLCDGCLTDLPWLGKRQCTVCALPLETEGSTCGGCLKHPPLFSQCKALFRYSSPIDRLISQFKYHSDLAVGELLGALLAKHLISPNTVVPDCLLPMPLHHARLNERGFNQAALLAISISRQLSVSVAHHLCQRNRETAHQMGSTRKNRKKNLRGAFTCYEDVSGKSIAIIDDVVTTGATVNELAKTLLNAGARDVQVWCLARTPLP